jgi:hypothetical protein
VAVLPSRLRGGHLAERAGLWRLRVAQPGWRDEQLAAGAPGAGSGRNTTFQNSAQVLSIGVFFTLMIIGLSDSLPRTLGAGLRAQGVSPAVVAHVVHLPPVSVLFAAFLGYNPLQHLLGSSVLNSLSPCGGRQAHQRGLLPVADLGPVPVGAARGLHLRRNPLLHSSGRIVVTRHAVRARRHHHRRARSGPAAAAGPQGLLQRSLVDRTASV